MEKATKISYYVYQKFPSSREVSIFLNDNLIEKEDIISLGLRTMEGREVDL